MGRMGPSTKGEARGAPTGERGGALSLMVKVPVREEGREEDQFQVGAWGTQAKRDPERKPPGVHVRFGVPVGVQPREGQVRERL